jgi:hypothetical protein
MQTLKQYRDWEEARMQERRQKMRNPMAVINNERCEASQVELCEPCDEPQRRGREKNFLEEDQKTREQK